MAALNYLMGKPDGHPLIISTKPAEDAMSTGLVIIGIRTAIPVEYTIPPRKKP